MTRIYPTIDTFKEKKSHVQLQQICQLCVIMFLAINPVSGGGGVVGALTLAQWNSCSRWDMIGQEESLRRRFSVTVRGTREINTPNPLRRPVQK